MILRNLGKDYARQNSYKVAEILSNLFLELYFVTCSYNSSTFLQNLVAFCSFYNL